MPISLPNTGKAAVAALAVAGALIAPSAANAVVTIGPPMSSYDGNAACDADTCAVVHQSLPSLYAGSPPFNVTAPQNGVIVRYRLSGAGKIGGLFTGRYTDASKDVFVRSKATPEIPIYNYPGAEPPWIQLKEGLPIAQGEYIGLLMRKGSVLMLNDAPNVITDFWQPGPAIGVPTQAGVKGVNEWKLNQPTRAAFQAQIELDVDKDGLGDESQDPKVGEPSVPTIPPADDKAPTLDRFRTINGKLGVDISEGGVVTLVTTQRKAGKRCGPIRKPSRKYTRTRSSKGTVTFAVPPGTYCLYFSAEDFAKKKSPTRVFKLTINGPKK